MFENVIGQDEVAGTLKHELAEGILPGSMLFYGPPYSGKCTAALELARALTCEKKTAAWNCTCRSCELHRRLVHPNAVLLGSRYFEQEIAACAEVFRRWHRPAGRYLFIRSVRKLTRRFDPFLWEGNEARLKKIQTLLAEVEAQLEFFLPGVEYPEEPEVEERISRLKESCRQILKDANLEGIPVDRIRKANMWAQTSGSSRKVIILENAEEMQEGARNALLKTLEEPMPDVYFILLTSRKHGIIPTIASRLRPYRFVPRNDEASRTVLRRIFREETDRYESLQEYFLAYGVNLDMLRSLVDRFFSAVVEGPESNEDIRSLFDTMKKEGNFRLFLEELAGKVRDYRGSGEENKTDVLICRETWLKDIRDTLYRFERLNQSISLAAENLLYSMRRGAACAVS